MITHPGKKIIRKMGYLSDQRGIMNRLLREDNGWRTHLDHCRRFILEYTLKHRFKHVGILGSGWLLDVPLEEIASQSDQVYLFDIFHPAQVMHLANKYSSVVLVQADITGGLMESVYRLTREYRKTGTKTPLQNLEYPVFEPNMHVDIWISVNILSQLDSIMVEYLRKYDLYSEEELRIFSSLVQQRHLDFITSHRSVLISDVAEQVYFTNGKPDYEKTFVYPVLPPCQNREEWTWQFDTTGAYYHDRTTLLRVVALAF